MLNALAARFEGEPSLVAPGADARFDSCLQAVMRLPRADDMLSESFPAHATADDGFWPAADSWKASYRPYVVSDGVLQIPVKGVLLNDFPWAAGYATGYVYILRAAVRGMADPQVRGLALICDTPGGMVAGNFDLVDKLYALRGDKPIRAFAHEAAYSAGYSIASAADRIIVSRTGGVGSIGVVTGHVDRSKALAEAGLKVTFIFAGKHKVDGNATEPLAPSVKARMQARIDKLYAVFVATVARNRGMSEAAVRATEALTYTAEEAVTEGLADAIGSLDDEVAAFAAEITPPDKDTTMITPEAHEAAVSAARAEGEAKGHAAGVKEGTASAHVRLTAVLGDEKVKGRETAAIALALASPDMSAGAVVAFVSKHGAAAAPAPTSRLDALMSDPKVDAATGGAAPEASDPWGAAVEHVNASTHRSRR